MFRLAASLAVLMLLPAGAKAGGDYVTDAYSYEETGGLRDADVTIIERRTEIFRVVPRGGILELDEDDDPPIGWVSRPVVECHEHSWGEHCEAD